MLSTDIVFIVLVYRNYNDLYDFCISIKRNVKASYKIVIVDAYFNMETSIRIEACAQELHCDYIQVENKGYGYGNNRGLEYANKMFKFNYACICNPDTVLRSNISNEILERAGACVAPNIIASKGKHQNPYWVYENKISEWLMYTGYVRESKAILYAGIAINKIIRELFMLYVLMSKNDIFHVYACHGSFFFLSNEFLQKTNFKYDERMFLFHEEAYMAFQIKQEKEKISFVKTIKVMHKEDGSMKLSKINEYPHMKNSYEIYYEKCRMKKRK